MLLVSPRVYAVFLTVLAFSLGIVCQTPPPPWKEHEREVADAQHANARDPAAAAAARQQYATENAAGLLAGALGPAGIQAPRP